MRLDEFGGAEGDEGEPIIGTDPQRTVMVG